VGRPGASRRAHGWTASLYPSGRGRRLGWPGGDWVSALDLIILDLDRVIVHDDFIHNLDLWATCLELWRLETWRLQRTGTFQRAVDLDVIIPSFFGLHCACHGARLSFHDFHDARLATQRRIAVVH
jgi:hypothetical protein